MPSAKVAARTWAEHQVTTKSERIAFLDACQRHFETVRVVQSVSASVRPRATTLEGHAPTSFVALDDAATCLPAHTACAVCGAAHAGTAMLVNPFSDWVVALCGACQPR